MASFDSYEQIRQAEDVEDEIYVISPVDNPVCSMAKTTRATGKLHEWSQDVLQAAGVNAAVEGAAAPADSSVAITAKQNYCQIMTKAAEITGTLETVEKYGRDSEMSYQLELRYGELANDEEMAVVGAPGGSRQAASAGSSSTARTMASLQTQLASSVTVDATSASTIALLETSLLEAHEKCYSLGGNPNYLFTAPKTAQYISSFAYQAGRSRDFGSDKTYVNVIDLYVSNFGQLDVVLDRNQDSTTLCLLGLDFNYLSTPVLRATKDWPTAKVGDSDARQILRESTFAVLNDEAHFMVDNISDSISA